MGFSRQEYWSGLPFPSPGDLPDPGIESASPVAPELHCLENPMDGGAWWAAVYGVAKSQTRLSENLVDVAWVLGSPLGGRRPGQLH